jgi:periplasmic divalent cation tolerance protein
MTILITTIHKKDDGHRIGKGLLKERLIVCYNLFPVESAYWWKGKIEEGTEVMMLMKTKSENFSIIEAYIKKNSGYEVPEVIQVDVAKVNSSYLEWLSKELT